MTTATMPTTTENYVYYESIIIINGPTRYQKNRERTSRVKKLRMKERKRTSLTRLNEIEPPKRNRENEYIARTCEVRSRFFGTVRNGSRYLGELA